MRLFLAILLPDHIREILRKTAWDLRCRGARGSFVPAENYHLTLVFLGEVADRQPVMEAMSAVRVPALTLELDALGDFSGVKGKTLFVALKHNDLLLRLREDLCNELRKRSIPFDQKVFRPHLTVARRFVGERGALAGGKHTFEPDGISLMWSKPGADGVSYEEIFFLK